MLIKMGYTFKKAKRHRLRESPLYQIKHQASAFQFHDSGLQRSAILKHFLDFTQLFSSLVLHKQPPERKNPYNTQDFWPSILTSKVRANQQHTGSSSATSGDQRLVFISLLSALDSSNPGKDILTSENRTIHHPLLPSNLTETCYYGTHAVWV